MACSHREDAQHNIIDLSQLGYKNPECTAMDGTCKLCEEMLVIDKSVNNAVAHLKELLSRQQQLRTQINNTHSPVIRDLPPEILSKVFYSCFSDEMASENGEPAKGDVGIPFKLGAVCRTWRQVAWSSPELWTVIVFNKHSSTAFNACNQHLMIKERIERSGSLPLYISLYEHAEEDDDDDYDYDDDEEGKGKGQECECWETSLRLLAQCSHRWKDVKMDLLRGSFKYIASNFKFKPPIRKLTLRSDDYQGWNDESKRLKLWQEPYEFGPRHVQINPPILFGHFSINWLHVRHVDVKRWPVEDCLNLLKSAPQLVSCSFEDMSRGWGESQPVPVVWHQSLQSLYVACARASSSASFFDHVAFPSLENFDYSYPGSRDALDGPSLILFFTRSRFPLKKLSILAEDVKPEHLLSILSTVPTLTHLCLRFSTLYGGPESKQSMTYLLLHLAKTRSTCETDDNNPDSFLPRLEILETEGPGGYLSAYQWTLVPNVFGRRSKLGAVGRRPLNAIVLDTGRPHSVEGVPKDTVARLRSLQKVGIIISYRVMPDGWKVPIYRLRSDARSHWQLVPVTWK
ncbi:hypothetical protein CPC08DRAFT_717131 [Agrocybe pediades]|nr:hypothetical protein CPC08DRAFT_717131 [Agrocybe pediades]